MKQHSRLIARPASFFSQLQWSPNHWPILAAFMLVALVEACAGNYGHAYSHYAALLQQYSGLDLNLAIWVVTGIRVVLMVLCLYLINFIVWFFGTLIGEAGSPRVLFRRLTIVFTVLLAGYTLKHLSAHYSELIYVAFGLTVWSGLLAYHALREQFELGFFGTAILASFLFILVAGSWKYSRPAIDGVTSAIIAKSSPVMRKRVR